MVARQEFHTVHNRIDFLQRVNNLLQSRIERVSILVGAAIQRVHRSLNKGAGMAHHGNVNKNKASLRGLWIQPALKSADEAKVGIL
jgi:hypothetical protein